MNIYIPIQFLSYYNANLLQINRKKITFLSF
jgi:hypothetical protein